VDFRIGRKEIKAQQKEIQVKSLDFLRRIEPCQGVTPTPRARFLSAPLPASKAAAWAWALLVRFGLFVIPSVFISGPPV
jgi:hypothetical protein